jgi:SAM-dependent methyltransferase
MNEYSPLWFKTFLETIPEEQTEKETAFVARFLPQPKYATILDLCCGEGRHARLLAEGGYRVTGLDRDASAIESARRQSNGAHFLVGDMRGLKHLHDNFDAVICLWQSFGDFDDATNADIIKQIADKLGASGRFILDIFHRGFFEVHQGIWTLERGRRTVIERKWMSGNRLTVELDYGAGCITDHFERQLYMPNEIIVLCARFGFDCILSCTEFDENKPVTAEKPRMQIVFEKR